MSQAAGGGRRGGPGRPGRGVPDRRGRGPRAGLVRPVGGGLPGPQLGLGRAGSARPCRTVTEKVSPTGRSSSPGCRVSVASVRSSRLRPAAHLAARRRRRRPCRADGSPAGSSARPSLSSAEPQAGSARGASGRRAPRGGRRPTASAIPGCPGRAGRPGCGPPGRGTRMVRAAPGHRTTRQDGRGRRRCHQRLAAGCGSASRPALPTPATRPTTRPGCTRVSRLLGCEVAGCPDQAGPPRVSGDAAAARGDAGVHDARVGGGDQHVAAGLRSSVHRSRRRGWW